MATATVTAQRIRIPQEGEFGADETYIPAPALEALAVDLIARHPETLGDLADLQIAALCELKPAYWRCGVANLQRIEAEMATPDLLSLIEAAG